LEERQENSRNDSESNYMLYNFDPVCFGIDPRDRPIAWLIVAMIDCRPRIPTQEKESGCIIWKSDRLNQYFCLKMESENESEFL